MMWRRSKRLSNCSTDGRLRFGITLVASSGWNPKRPPTIETSAVRMVADRYNCHVYDFDDLCLLSAALSDALGLVQKSVGGPLTETETSDFRERLAANLFLAFDFGERDPAALKRAAIKGVLWTSRNRDQRRSRSRHYATERAGFETDYGTKTPSKNIAPPVLQILEITAHVVVSLPST